MPVSWPSGYSLILSWIRGYQWL